MRTAYHITADIYEQIAENASRYGRSHWDCIELEDGCAITYEVKEGRPFNVKVYDEDDVQLDHDFSIYSFELYKNMAA